MIITGTVRFTTKSRKVRCAPEPIRMLGGSPMSVAVPPMFDAITMGSRNAIGGIASCSAICIAIGVTKITVVTLSASADRPPVNHVTSRITVRGSPRVPFISRATAQVNTPVDLRTPTTAIIDASRSSTFRSSARCDASSEMRCQGVT